jgi:hypothetical protein
MHLKKIINTDHIQAFNISSVSEEFKRKYPKKYILSVYIKNYKLSQINKEDILSTNETLVVGYSFVIINTNKIPNMLDAVGYIFTYEQNINAKFRNNFYNSQPIQQRTIPKGLSQYFIDTDKYKNPINLILNIVPNNSKPIPIQFSVDIIIRTNDKIVSSKSIKGNVMNVINKYLENLNKLSTEEIVTNIINNGLLNVNRLPINYSLTFRHLDVNDILIYYDYRTTPLDDREKTYQNETDFIINFEEAFENKNETFRLYYDYNNVAHEIEQIFKNNKLKYIRTDNYIEFTIKTLRKAESIGINYSIIDFI